MLSILTTVGIIAVLVTETYSFFQMAAVEIAKRDAAEVAQASAVARSKTTEARSNGKDAPGDLPEEGEAVAKPVVEAAVPQPSMRRAFLEFATGTEWAPQFAEKHFGILPLLCGTLLVAGIASLIGIPIGLASAMYLSEYATPRTRSIVKPILEVLAGIPTVVYGYFALVFITPYLLRPIFSSLLGFEVDVYNAASAGVTVGIMIIPTISSMSEDVLRAVPRGLREAAYGLGSTKFDVSVRVVLPAALSGIFASFLLAVSRAIGETMAVTIAAGQNPQLTLNPFLAIESMTAYIVNVSMGDTPAGSVEYTSIYAVAMTLFLITLATNILSQVVLRRFREVYQ